MRVGRRIVVRSGRGSGAGSGAGIGHCRTPGARWVHDDEWGGGRPARPANPGEPGVAARRPVLVRQGPRRVVHAAGRPARRDAVRLAVPAVEGSTPADQRGDRGGSRDGDAPVAVPGAPMGTDRLGGVHPDRLVDPGMADRAAEPGTDRGQLPGPAVPAVPAHGTDRDHRVGRRTTQDRRAGRGHLRPVGRRDHRRGRIVAGRCDMTGAAIPGPTDAESVPITVADAEPGTRSADPDLPWRRLSPGMLLVEPVRELIRYIPMLLVLLIAGSGSDSGPPWSLIGAVAVIALGIVRYLSTRFRITPAVVEVRRGILQRKHLTVPRDRIRTLDVSAHPLQRLLGLVRVDVGTGSSHPHAPSVRLDGLA